MGDTNCLTKRALHRRFRIFIQANERDGTHRISDEEKGD